MWDVVEPADVRAGSIGEVLGDLAVAAAQVEHALAATEPCRLDQELELFEICEAVLAEIPAEDALAEGAVRLAGSIAAK